MYIWNIEVSAKTLLQVVKSAILTHLCDPASLQYGVQCSLKRNKGMDEFFNRDTGMGLI